MAIDARGDTITLQTASVTTDFVRGGPLELDSSGDVLNSATGASIVVIGFVEAPLPTLTVAAQRQIAVRLRGLIEATGAAAFDGTNDTTISPGDYLVSNGASDRVKRVVGTSGITAANMNSAGGAVLGMVVSGDVTEPGSGTTTGTVRFLIMRM